MLSGLGMTLMLMVEASLMSELAWLLEPVEPDLRLPDKEAALLSGARPREGALPLEPFLSWDLSLSPDAEKEG